LPIVSAAVPVLLMVTDREVLEVLTVWLPKLSAVELREITPADVVPEPSSETTDGLAPAL
jgi:hypothetical protein